MHIPGIQFDSALYVQNLTAFLNLFLFSLNESSVFFLFLLELSAFVFRNLFIFDYIFQRNRYIFFAQLWYFTSRKILTLFETKITLWCGLNFRNYIVKLLEITFHSLWKTTIFAANSSYTPNNKPPLDGLKLINPMGGGGGLNRGNMVLYAVWFVERSATISLYIYIYTICIYEW